MQFPREFESSHFACLYMHDVMVEFIRSGYEQKVFTQSFNISALEIQSLESSNLHIFDWLERQEKTEERTLVISTAVLPAVLSDMLHCIFESLSASKKSKMAVAYMLIRKPLQESLYLLESIVLNQTNFAEQLSNDPLKLRAQNAGGPDGHARRIHEVLDKLGLSEVLDSQYISELRYDKKSFDSFDRVCNHAMHLFTEHKSIRTELLNINFIFSGAAQVYTQQRYLYTRLPYLMYYMYHVFESIADIVAPTTNEYFININRRIAAYFLLAYLEMDKDFISEQMDNLAGFLQSLLEIDLAADIDSQRFRDYLINVGATGELQTSKTV